MNRKVIPTPFLAALVAVAVAAGAAGEALPPLETVIHEPTGKVEGLAVIAPGAGYHMDMPVIVQSAEQAASVGYRTLRFNWRYFTAGTERGSDRKDERRDLEEAIASFTEAYPEVEHVVLIGKSLGSIVTASVAAKSNRPVLLLTPVCRSSAEFRRIYAHGQHDAVFIAGDDDPLCDTKILFAGLEPHWKVAIVEGDHSLEGETDEATARNVAVVAQLVGYWLEALKQ